MLVEIGGKLSEKVDLGPRGPSGSFRGQPGSFRGQPGSFRGQNHPLLRLVATLYACSNRGQTT